MSLTKVKLTANENHQQRHLTFV